MMDAARLACLSVVKLAHRVRRNRRSTALGAYPSDPGTFQYYLPTVERNGENVRCLPESFRPESLSAPEYFPCWTSGATALEFRPQQRNSVQKNISFSPRNIPENSSRNKGTENEGLIIARDESVVVVVETRRKQNFCVDFCLNVFVARYSTSNLRYLVWLDCCRVCLQNVNRFGGSSRQCDEKAAKITINDDSCSSC